ncbi:6-hydroxymethylpterin diphosphokinase MptE-like protein [Neptuniibacter sp. QD29_5]|uniref:motility associated factor glycosyltransferase family protein n=1 Tax=Neptuniibacter sp. QD29_5 TaxID=3398207 RepID=UPI0039F4BCEA
MNDLESLKKKLERLEKNKNIDALFTKNLNLFKEKLPPLYEEYKSYSVSELTIAFDEDDNINIRNVNGSFVYSENPYEFANKQYELFLKNARPTIIQYGDTGSAVFDDYLHQHMTTELLDLYGSGSRYISKGIKEDYLQTVIVLGIGAGFHISRLALEKDIKNLIIYDLHLDSIYLSMHMIDWEPIVNKYCRPGYNIEFCAGKTEDESFIQLTKLFKRIGNFNLSKFYVYDHYKSKKLDGLIARVKNNAHDIVFGMGFYDDERVGLAHTVESVSQRYPVSRICLMQRKRFCDVPVILVGNGPSLDENEDFIKKNIGKAIIISCGTTLGTLEKKGIKPDIHVEQERPYNTYVWLNNSTTAEFRKGISFFALNTVHPKVYTLFDKDKRHICVKPNDLGAMYLFHCLSKVPGNGFSLAEMCNPTVTNFGLSLCTLLGLRRVIMIGVDLGVADPEDHHSKDSPYYGNTGLDFAEYIRKQGFFKAEGNLGGDVWTTHIYSMSKITIERLIAKHKMTVLNLGQGVKIDGAIPVNNGELEFDGSNVDKEKIISEILPEVFSFKNIEPLARENLQRKVSDNVHLVNDKVIQLFIPDLSEEEDINLLLRNIHYVCKDPELGPFVLGLIEGSVNYFCSIMSSLIALSDKDDRLVIYNKARRVIIDFLEKQKADVDNRLFELDGFSNY